MCALSPAPYFILVSLSRRTSRKRGFGLHRDGCAAHCRRCTTQATTSMHAMGTFIPSDFLNLAAAESAASTAGERCPFQLEMSALWATPYACTPFLWGPPSPLATPTPCLCFLHAPMPRPSQCCVPCASAAAAWHRDGMTRLMYAAANGHADAVALLAWMHADVNAQTSDG